MRVLCLLFLLSAGSLGFVLRKRPWEEPSSLNDALDIIRQERKRLHDAEVFQLPREEVNDYYWPEESRNSDELLSDFLQDEEEPRISEPNDFQYFQPAEPSELEDIMKPSDSEASEEIEEKKSAPLDLREPGPMLGRPKKEYDPSSLVKKNDIQTLTDEEMQEILDAADRAYMLEEEEQEEAEEAGDNSTIEPVSQKEIERVLQPGEEEQEVVEEEETETPEWFLPPPKQVDSISKHLTYMTHTHN